MMGKAALGKAANGISGRVSKVRTARFPNPSSPCFTSNAGDCCPYIAIYKTDLTLFVHNQKVGGDLGLGPDSAMTPAMSSNRSCWVVFRMSAVHQTEGRKSVHRDSFGRFAADGGGGDTTSLGWNDFMPMATFTSDGESVGDGGGVPSGGAPANQTNLLPDSSSGFLQGPDGKAVFSVSFHAVREVRIGPFPNPKTVCPYKTDTFFL